MKEIGNLHDDTYTQLTSELEAAFLLELQHKSNGSPETDIFLAHQDRLAKEKMLDAYLNPEVAADEDAVDLPVRVAAQQVPVIQKPKKDTNEGRLRIQPSEGSLHPRYEPAAQLAAKIAISGSESETVDTHGLPLSDEIQASELTADIYQQFIGKVLSGEYDPSVVPSPRTSTEIQKAKQALATIAGITPDPEKDSDWTARFFEVQSIFVK